VRIWEQFFLGFAIGSISLLVPLIWTPMMNLGIPALRIEPWPSVRLALAIAVSLGVIWLLGRWTGRLRRLYRMVAAILLVNGLIWALLMVGPNEYFLWDLSWTWGYSAAVLGIAVAGCRLSRRSGLPALLAVMVGLGMMNSINLTMADVAAGKTPYGQYMLLLAYLIPLVICPAWLLFAPTWRQKKFGVLLSWAAMLAAVVLVLPLVDSFLGLSYFRHLRLVDILGNLVAYVPPFIGLWLALALYEASLPGPANLSSLTDSPAGAPGDHRHRPLACDAP
jgi:hypothetical protein